MQLVLGRYLAFNACCLVNVKLSCISHDAVSIESFTRWHLCYVVETYKASERDVTETVEAGDESNMEVINK